MKPGYTEKSRPSGLYFGAIAGTVIVIGVIIFILLLGKSTTKEAEVILSDSFMEVEGMYGAVYNFQDISQVELKDTIPKVETKTNGSGIGEAKKGDFVLTGLGECRLFISSNKGPFIYINVSGKYVIINFKDSKKTEQLYQELMGKWKK